MADISSDELTQSQREQEQMDRLRSAHAKALLKTSLGRAGKMARQGDIKGQLKQAGKEYAKQAAKLVIKKAGTRIAASAAWSAIAWAAAAALPVIGIILLILLVIFLAVYMICNPEGLLALIAAYGAELSGTLPKEACDAVNSSFGSVGQAVQSAVSAVCSIPDDKGNYITGINCPSQGGN